MDYKEIDQWVLRAQAGDSEAAAFLEQMFRPLMLASADKARPANYSFEDCLQDARLFFLEGIRHYDGARAGGFAAYIKTYLYRSLQNKRRKCQRRLVRDISGDGVSAEADEGTLFDTLADPSVDIAWDYIRDEELAALSETLDELTPEELALLSALYGQGLTIRSAAQSLGVGYSTLQYRHRRLLDRLKKKLTEEPSKKKLVKKRTQNNL